MLEKQLVGVYLQGSFALRAADEDSDVDFVVVIKEPLSPEAVARLDEMHGRIFDLPSHWARVLEGSYFPASVLRDVSRRGRDLWYLDNGARRLMASPHCDTAIVRYLVREHGIVLTGPDPRSLLGPVSSADLALEMRAMMADLSRQVFAEPARYANRFYQGFIVLSFCRMWCDLAKGQPGSKRRGATWARARAGPEFVGLIDRAWSTRSDPALAVRTPADAADFQRTLAFVRWVLDHRHEPSMAGADAGTLA